jgi:hypothetical protein
MGWTQRGHDAEPAPAGVLGPWRAEQGALNADEHQDQREGEAG